MLAGSSTPRERSMSSVLVAILVTLTGLAASYWWFGVHRRRQAETEAGVNSLAGMKWRECVGLVLEALSREGFREAPSSRQPGDGGTEFVLTRNNEQVLLAYKHGTAYRLGEANVRDFANGVQLQGATSGILLTLGSADGAARDVARRYGVEVIDGHALWPKVQDYVPAPIVDQVRREAAEKTKRGLWVGSVISVLVGIAVLVATHPFDFSSVAEAPVAAVPAAAPAAVAKMDTETAQMNAAAQAMEKVARMTDAERAQRRAQAAAKVASIAQIANAGWSTQSTLLVSLAKTDGQDTELTAEVCRLLTQYEELRYTRVQLDPPLDSKVSVRWRQCQ
jgi:restriction system protein